MMLCGGFLAFLLCLRTTCATAARHDASDAVFEVAVVHHPNDAQSVAAKVRIQHEQESVCARERERARARELFSVPRRIDIYLAVETSLLKIASHYAWVLLPWHAHKTHTDTWAVL